MIRWRIYYDDGSTFSDTDGPPGASPAWGVVAIAQRVGAEYDNVLCSGVPWYVYRTDYGFWVELDQIGFHDILINHTDVVDVVRPGRYIRSPRFKEIWATAREWVDGN